MRKQSIGSCIVAALTIMSFTLEVNSLQTRVTWINGIGYNEKHMEEQGREISRMFGSNVSYCFNPTAMANDDDFMGYLNDLFQAGTQKLGRVTMEVDALVKHLKEATAAVGKKGRVIHIAHSQGALLTALASRQLSVLEMNRIEVIAFGGAAALRRTPQTPFHRCVNYYSVNDPLLFVVPEAEQALRSGYVVDEEFCFLAPKDGDPIRDHHLLGPTYIQALSWEGRKYQQTYHSIAYRVVQMIFALLASVVDAIVATIAQTLVALSSRVQNTRSSLFLTMHSRVLLPIRLWLIAALRWVVIWMEHVVRVRQAHTKLES